MTAHVRIARDPGRAFIWERGPIPAPDLVVVADDTLLDDPGARPLAGLGPAGALLIATAHDAEEVRQHTGHPGPIVARDFRSLGLEHVGSAAGGSAALAAAACVLLGLSAAAASAALRSELEVLGLPPEVVAANLRVAEQGRRGLVRLDLSTGDGDATRPTGRVVDVAYAPPEVGSPTVTAKPNTRSRRTGNWRVFRPVIVLERCTRCWICFVYCPEGAIALDADDTPRIDYEVCKGCLVCLEECPTHAIAKVAEGRRWDPVGAVS